MEWTPRRRNSLEGGEEPIKSLEDRLSAVQEAVLSKRAEDVVIIDLRPLSAEVDAFFICHGTSGRQVRAIAEAADEKLKEMGERPLFIEGLNESNWVLIDCGDLLIHVFKEKTRDFYRLEDLWSHAPLMKVSGVGT